ncbi:MAG: DUF2490 domain-containing protein [Candidatus Zixiibacteriota bacterium]|nr:MAG: DUF2490 domain-containing protein [candidate division Zixibacteria bacterium]
MVTGLKGRDVLKAAFLVFLVSLFLPSYSYGDNSEHWNDLYLSRKIGRATSLSLASRTKFNDIPFDDVYIVSLKLGSGYGTGWNLTITPSYRIDWIDKKDKDEYENRYSLQLDYRKTVRGINTTFTQISELRYFTQATRDHIRLRFRLNMSRNIGTMLNRRASFYIMPEIFYDDIKNEIFRFRFYSGFNIALKDNISLKIGYILQNEKDKDDIHLFNTGLGWKII